MEPEQNTNQQLTLYRVSADAFPIYPGNPSRVWMDESPGRFAYRCLPMTIANTSGWEIVCPVSFEATWDGGAGKDSLKIRLLDEVSDPEIISSHFGSGILTFRIGYVLHTAEGWGTWVKGVPNQVIEGIQPLEGLVETDWLPFTFTMNWKFTRPGTIRFERNTSVALIMVLPYSHCEEIQPIVRDISSNPDLNAAFTQWRDQRRGFNLALTNADPAAIKQGWQRHYFRGQGLDGEQGTPNHVSRRRLKRVCNEDGSQAFVPLPTLGTAVSVTKAKADYHRTNWCSGDYAFKLGSVSFGE